MDDTIYTPKLWVPSFDDETFGNWRIESLNMVPMRGYWGTRYLVDRMPILFQGGVGSWMSVCPSEIESQEIGCRLAHGHTLVMGFGMGIAAANTALNPAVTAVTVLEIDTDVLNQAHKLLAQLPTTTLDKIHLIQADASLWQPDQPVETLLADIWRPLYDAGREHQVLEFQQRIKAEQVFFWGQELNLAESICREFDGPRILDDVELEAFIDRHFKLPLIWPRNENYGELIFRAAQTGMEMEQQQRLGIASYTWEGSTSSLSF
ncbi:hypothetical protein [Marinobacterium arenosum]|uniref:hypothetical protein n=1 Tax=Marinobacterium arenosum TaxID=2862496 RepID=UPI001C97077B|nr:hypothetical protein [Marinobacterium arenosum]MBY4677671.1 hypothetical protein [Marinobacterium arenosum]